MSGDGSGNYKPGWLDRSGGNAARAIFKALSLETFGNVPQDLRKGSLMFKGGIGGIAKVYDCREQVSAGCVGPVSAHSQGFGQHVGKGNLGRTGKENLKAPSVQGKALFLSLIGVPDFGL